MPRRLKKRDLFDVANGAGFMGSGGGGPLTTGINLVKQLPDDARVEVVDMDEVDGEKWTAVVADMGAPAAMLKVTSPDSMVAAFQQLRHFCEARGRALKYCLPVEVGGENTIAPLVVAHSLGLPCVDADGAGRAVPSLTQTTMYAAGVNADPAFLANDAGEAIGIHVRKTTRVEELARPILQDGFDEQAGLAMWPMDCATLKKAAPIHGNIEVARQLGRCLRESTGHPVRTVCRFFNRRRRGGYLMFRGKLIDYKVETTGGFDKGTATFHDEKTGKTFQTFSQNENLMAKCDGCKAPLATAPDSICYLTTDGRPFSNADIKKMQLIGSEVAVIGLKANQELRDSKKIRGSFRSALLDLGYDGKYIPIEEIEQVCVPEDALRQ